MRTQLLCALALAVAATAGSASAQDADSINVQSTVTPRCAALASPGTSLELTSLVDVNGQIVADFGGTTSIDLGSYWCNAPATVSMTATPLTNAQTVYDSVSFTNRVDYTAAIDWDDFDHTKSSVTAGAEAFSTTQANIGPLLISVADPVVDDNKRPIAGDYTGSVTLTVAVQP